MSTYLLKHIWGIFIVVPSLVLGQVKLAQSGAQFLGVESDARAAALGGAVVTVEIGSAALCFNPAGMARMATHVDIAASRNQWIAGIVYNALSAAVPISKGELGVIGVSLVSVDYGEIQGTIVWPNDQGYLDTEIMHPTAFSAGIGYARALTDKFAVGGQVKYVGLNYGKSIYPDDAGAPDTVKKNLQFATAFDFGTIYKTGWKTLAFGMSVRNFSNEIKFEEEGFQLPLTFAIGISMDLFQLWSHHPRSQSLLVAVDAAHYRSHAEQLLIGVEYKPLPVFALRLGYRSGEDEQAFSYGLGIEKMGLSLDYTYTPFGVWDAVQRISVRFAL